ncbi:hypothetical protein IWX47DRAFT_637166 [Phyllosticta citricarpa]
MDRDHEILALAKAYIIRFKFYATGHPVPYLDDHTIALTCLYLAAKMTGVPNKLPQMLIGAWRILRPGQQGPTPPWAAMYSSSPLANGSVFLSLRNAVDAAESIMLRALAYDVHMDTPVLFDEAFFDQALRLAEVQSVESMDNRGQNTGIMKTAMGQQVRKLSLDAFVLSRLPSSSFLKISALSVSNQTVICQQANQLTT